VWWSVSPIEVFTKLFRVCHSVYGNHTENSLARIFIVRGGRSGVWSNCGVGHTQVVAQLAYSLQALPSLCVFELIPCLKCARCAWRRDDEWRRSGRAWRRWCVVLESLRTLAEMMAGARPDRHGPTVRSSARGNAPTTRRHTTAHKRAPRSSCSVFHRRSVWPLQSMCLGMSEPLIAMVSGS
jgi:hypothetical protein